MVFRGQSMLWGATPCSWTCPKSLRSAAAAAPSSPRSIELSNHLMAVKRPCTVMERQCIGSGCSRKGIIGSGRSWKGSV